MIPFALAALMAAAPAPYAGVQAWRGEVPAGVAMLAPVAEGGVFVLPAGRVPPKARALVGNGPWPSGRLMVEVRAGADAGSVLGRAGLTEVRQLSGAWWGGDAGDRHEGVARALLKDPDALQVAFDFVRRFDVRSPFDDELFDLQWHLENTGQRADTFAQMTAGADMNVRGAWSTTLGDPDVVIAVLDSGQEFGHPDFPVGDLVAPLNALTGAADATPPAFEFLAAHGISCAGLAAASRAGTTGTVGVCPECRVMPIRIFDEVGFGTDTGVVDAFDHALENGAQIASNSWGYVFESVPAPVLDALGRFASEGRDGLGGVVVFALGNTGDEAPPGEIGNDPRALAVGGTGADDERVGYSSFGQGLDVMAPTGHDTGGDDAFLGPQLVTTDRLGDDGFNPNEDPFIDPGYITDVDYTGVFSGTSGACPQVAGLAGLMLSIAPELRYEQVFAALRDSAVKVGGVPYDERGFHPLYGSGRVDAAATIAAVSAGNLCEPAAELCDNGLDEDCDGAIDDADEDCGFVLPGLDVDLGALCNPNDFLCGEGLCAPVDFVQGIGLCTELCGGGDCPAGGVCAEVSEARICLASCLSDDDCEDPFLCTTLPSGERGCYAGCELIRPTDTNCPEGTTCGPAAERCGDGDEPPPPPPPPVDAGPSDLDEVERFEQREVAIARIAASPSCAAGPGGGTSLFLVSLLVLLRQRRRRGR